MNKRLIFLFIGLIVLVILIVLNSAVFVIKDISVSSDYGGSWYNAEDIINASSISEGRNIFILSEKKAGEYIEDKNPYVRVTSIERKFPNKIIIHITLRVPVIAIKVSGTNDYLITDWELKVIDVAAQPDELYKSAVKIKGVNVTVTGDARDYIGTTLEDEALDYIVELADAAAQMGIRDEGLKTFFNSVDFSTVNHCFVKTNAGVTFIFVTGTDTAINEQFQYVYSMFVEYALTDKERTSGYLYNDGSGWKWHTANPV
ncbi:MAG: cell division protein FtsQ/DivIB [Christensenellales bacterium]|jgi:hypothetical protein